MSKKLVITLEDDGTVYRGKKLIATVKDGEVKFKHYSYRKHADEIEMLKLTADALAENNSLITADDLLTSSDDLDVGSCEPVADIGLEPIVVPVPEYDRVPEHRTDCPKSLFSEGEGAWYGESNPPVVEWRKKYWSKEDFDAKYGHREAHLTEVYNKHNLIYDRNNSID
jgi:hypothetical protein